MRRPRLYTPQVMTRDAELALDANSANHLAKVLRAAVGDPLILFNGNGQDYTATVCSIGKRDVTVRIEGEAAVHNESPVAFHLGLAMSKGDRFDWAVQKATEMGVSQITPLSTRRVDVKLDANRSEKKRQHWQQIAISACEQCGRATIPTLNAPVALATWLSTVSADVKLVLHHHRESELTTLAPSSAALLVGPEGGLTAEEVDNARSQGFLALRLGPRVMRTETAPIAALAVLGAQWGDLLSP